MWVSLGGTGVGRQSIVWSASSARYPDLAKTTRLSNVTAGRSPCSIFHYGKCGYDANFKLPDEAWPRGISAFRAVEASFIPSATSHQCWPSVVNLTSRGVGETLRTTPYGLKSRPNERRGCRRVEMQDRELKCDNIKRHELL